jgi:hypothetical protein
MRVKELKARRKAVRKLGFRIYKSKRKAVILAWLFSRINQEVNWVVKEPEGYMVLNSRLMERLNIIRKIKDGKKIRERDMNKMCIYRGFPKSWGKIKVNQNQRLRVVER